MINGKDKLCWLFNFNSFDEVIKIIVIRNGASNRIWEHVVFFIKEYMVHEAMIIGRILNA